MNALALLIIVPIFIVLILSLRAVAIWALWNWVVVSITAADEITFLQSLLASVLLLFILPAGTSAAKNVASKS